MEKETKERVVQFRTTARLRLLSVFSVSSRIL